MAPITESPPPPAETRVPSEVGHFTADPRVAVSAAWQLAVDEGDAEKAVLLKRLKDAWSEPIVESAGGDTPGLPPVEGEDRERASSGADGGARATTAEASEAPPEVAVAAAAVDTARDSAGAVLPVAATAPPCSASRAQVTQLRAQLVAFRRLTRGLSVPSSVMAAASVAAEGSDDDGSASAMDASRPVGTNRTRRRWRERLVLAKAGARTAAIAALSPKLPDEVRLAAAIESKALALIALQRKVRYEVAMEPRLARACAMPGTLLDSLTLRRNAGLAADQHTYVETITRAEALKMQEKLMRENQAAQRKRKAQDHSRRMMEIARENQRRMEEARAAEREKARLVMMARRREQDARVAVVAERRRWLAQLLQHGRDNKEAEKAERLRQKKRNDGVLAFHRKAQNGLRREERERIQALKAGDEEAYMRLVQDTKNQRIEELLQTTDDLLKHLANRIEAMKKATARAAVDPHLADDDEGADGLPSGSNIGNDAVVSPQRFSGIRQFGKLVHSAEAEDVVVQPSILVGPNGKGTMRSYQMAGLQWMISLYNNNLNGILADEMGLGKTIQCISLFAYLAEVKDNHGPHLVLAPKAVLPNWAREFKIWYPDCGVVFYDGTKDTRKALREEHMKGSRFNVLLTHYDLAMYDKRWLSDVAWDYIVVDEGHRLKNHQSKLSTVLQAAYTTKHRLLLTGTPIQNNLTELWSLLNFLLPTVFNSSDGFETWFNAPFSTNKDDTRLKEEEELLIIQRLHQVIRPFLLRRKKKEVEKELPDKEEVTIKCDMSAWQRAYYRQVIRNGAVSTTEGKTRQLQNTAMQLRKVCNHPYLFLQDDFYIPTSQDEIIRAAGKFEMLDRILPKLQKSGHRVLLFSQMVKCMDIISDYLKWRGYDFLRLDGATETQARGELLEKFNAPDSPYFLFMLSTRAGSMGLNLQTADTVIIFDSDWNPQMDAQAEDRAHRIGQKRRVKVLVFVSDGTIEEDILKRAADKKAIDHKAIQAGMFNQRSTAEERNKLLKDILQRGDGSVGAEVTTSTELNVMIARSEEEIDMFEEMDKESEEAWKREWGPSRGRLMNENELPDEVRWPDQHGGGNVEYVVGGGGARGKKKTKEEEMQENMLSSEDDGQGGRRRRKRRAAQQTIRYDDGLSDGAFLKILENGGDKSDLAEASLKMHKRREKRAEKRERENGAQGGRPSKMQKVGTPGRGGGRGRGRPSNASKLAAAAANDIFGGQGKGTPKGSGLGTGEVPHGSDVAAAAHDDAVGTAGTAKDDEERSWKENRRRGED